jgi:hypothetical protein
LFPGRKQPSNARELLAVGIFGSKSRIGDRIETLFRRGRTFALRASAAAVTASAVVLGCLMLEQYRSSLG